MAADELIHIYSGSFLNAQFVANVLDENNIKTSIMISHNQNINDYSKHISALSAAG